MQHGGFTRMPTTSCGKWFDIQPFVIRAKVSPEVPRSMLWWRSRWRCFVPFPKIHTSLMFSGFLKDSIKYFFHPLPQETPLGDTNIMQKWWGKRNVWLEIWCNSCAYFLCHCGVSIPQIFQGSMMVSFRFTKFTKTSLPRASKTPWACGKRPKKLSEFCGACRKGVAGEEQRHLDFHEIHWFILEGWQHSFWGFKRAWFGLNVLCEMMLEDDGFFFCGMSGNS